MLEYWSEFMKNIQVILPNVEEHWAHGIMNDMTSSLMYGLHSFESVPSRKLFIVMKRIG
jgi:hypothetical protein